MWKRVYLVKTVGQGDSNSGDKRPMSNFFFSLSYLKTLSVAVYNNSRLSFENQKPHTLNKQNPHKVKDFLSWKEGQDVVISNGAFPLGSYAILLADQWTPQWGTKKRASELSSDNLYKKLAALNPHHNSCSPSGYLRDISQFTFSQLLWAQQPLQVAEAVAKTNSAEDTFVFLHLKEWENLKFC